MDPFSNARSQRRDDVANRFSHLFNWPQAYTQMGGGVGESGYPGDHRLNPGLSPGRPHVPRGQHPPWIPPANYFGPSYPSPYQPAYPMFANLPPNSMAPPNLPPQSMSSHHIPPHTMSPHSIAPHSMPSHPMPPHAMPPHAMPPHNIPPHMMHQHPLPQRSAPQGYPWPVPSSRQSSDALDHSEKQSSHCKGRKKQKPRKIDTQCLEGADEESSTLMFDPKSKEIRFEKEGLKQVKVEPTDLIPVVLPTASHGYPHNVHPMERMLYQQQVSQPQPRSVIVVDDVDEPLPDTGNAVSSVPDSTCPEDGPEPIAAENDGCELIIEKVNTVSSIMSLNSAGGRTGSDETASVECESFHVSSPENNCSSVDEPEDIIIEAKDTTRSPTDIISTNKQGTVGQPPVSAEGSKSSGRLRPREQLRNSERFNLSREQSLFTSQFDHPLFSEFLLQSSPIRASGNHGNSSHANTNHGNSNQGSSNHGNSNYGNSSHEDISMDTSGSNEYGTIYSSGGKKKYLCHKEGCRFVGRTCSEIRQHNEQHLKEFFTTGKFKCLLCSFANSHRVALQIHSVVHQGAAPFTCNVCGSGPFSSIKKLNLHIQSHTGENKFSCSHVNCSYTSNHSSNMNRHYRLKHNGVIPICQGTLSPSRYRCASCEFCSESEVIVAIHSIVHKKTPPYSCWACGKGGFLTPDSINWHTNTHLKDGSLALLPSYQFDDGATSAVGSSEEAVQPFTSANVDGVKQNLLELPPAQKRMKCLLCKFSTNQKLGMEIHSTVHKDLPPFQCSYCKEKGFKTNKQLAFHIQTHTGEAKYTCTYKECFYTSNHSSNMNRHYRLRHDHEHCTPSHCASSKSTICPANKHKQQFDSPPFSLVPELPAQEEPEPAVDSLETSAQTPAQTPTVNLDLSGADLTEKRYYCGECDFSTDGDRQWRLHQLKHLPRYHCTLCAFSSLANDVMKRHYRSVHKRPPPVFLTTTAPKETAKTTAESRHLKCNLCNFRTSYSDELTRHVQQMHVIKKCAMCNYMTVDKRQYNLHVEQHVMGLISTSKDKVEEESDEEDDGEYICDDCDFRTKLLSEWKTHVCSQGTPSPVKTVSEEVIIPQSTESSPTVSSNRGNPAGWEKFHCAKCRLEFSTEEEYTTHLTRHVGTYKCEQCDFSSEHEHWLQNHRKLHEARNVNKVPKLIKCHLCSYTALFMTRMRQHMNIHKGHRPYFCRICPFSTNNMSNIYRHLRGKHKIDDLSMLKSYVGTAANIKRAAKPLPSSAESKPLPVRTERSPQDVMSPVSKLKKRRLQSTESHSTEPEVVMKHRSSVDSQKHRDDITHKRKLPRIFSCDKCYYTTRDQDNLAAHVKSVHPSVSQEVTQPVDGSGDSLLSRDVEPQVTHNKREEEYQKFTSLYRGLNSHMPAAKDFIISTTMRVDGYIAPKYKCKLCGFVCVERRTVTSHITNIHINNESSALHWSCPPPVKPKKLYHCHLCDFITRITVELRDHYRHLHPADTSFAIKSYDTAAADFDYMHVDAAPATVSHVTQQIYAAMNYEEPDGCSPAAIFYSRAQATRAVFVSNKMVRVLQTKSKSRRALGDSASAGSALLERKKDNKEKQREAMSRQSKGWGAEYPDVYKDYQEKGYSATAWTA